MTRQRVTAITRSASAATGGGRRFGPAARLAAICLPTLLAACGGGTSEVEGWRALARLSQPPDASVFYLTDVTPQTVVRSWPLTETGDAGVWRIEPAAARGPADSRGTLLRTAAVDGQAPRLTARVDLEAAEVTVIELQLWAPEPTSAELLWANGGQLSAADRRIALDRPERDPDRRRVRLFRFRVGEHPRWRGSVRRLEIRFASDPTGEVTVGAVRALREEPNDQLLATAAARPWKVDLSSTLKEARLAFPGHAARTTVTVPDGDAELRFVPGLPAMLADGEVELSVRAATGDGGDELLFSATYSRAAGHGEGWQTPVRIPLTGLAGSELDLELAMATGDAASAAPFAAWGNVQLVLREREPRTPNVLLICLDTLRADRLSAYGHPRRTSPNIDRWAAERAVLFEQVVAPAPWTLPSFTSIFTGLDTIRHGVNYGLPAPAGLEMLAETLAREGYETVAWTGGGYLGPAHGLHQGFESLTYHLGPKERELSDNVGRALAWLRSPRDRPFFLLFHTYEVHDPYFERQPFYDRFAADSALPPIPSNWVAARRLPLRPEEGFVVRREITMSPDRGETWRPVPEELRPAVADRYDAGVAYADEQIGRLLAAVDEAGLAARTVVILTSDHGEALGEHGLGGHSYLYDFNLLVPLIVAAPSAGWPAGRTVRQQVRLVDIVPTVRELVGLEPDHGLDGESLTELALGRRGGGDRLAWSYAAVANRGVAVRTPVLKYVFNNSSPSPLFARERLVDLVRDPEELGDVAGERTEDLARFRRLVRRRLADDVAAVWFRLRSGDHHAMTVELSGSGLARPSRLKALELPGNGIRYAREPLDHAIVELPAAAEALLYFEPETTGRIRLAVSTAATTPGSRRWDLRLEELHAGAWAASVASGRWVERATGPGGRGPSLSIFSTQQADPAAGPARTSQDVEQQLRDLGYLQ